MIFTNTGAPGVTKLSQVRLLETTYAIRQSLIDRASIAGIRTFWGPLWSHGPTYIALTHEGNKLAHFNRSQCSNRPDRRIDGAGHLLQDYNQKPKSIAY